MGRYPCSAIDATCPRSPCSRCDRGPRAHLRMHRFMVDTRKDFVCGLPRSLDLLTRRAAAHVRHAPVHASTPARTSSSACREPLPAVDSSNVRADVQVGTEQSRRPARPRARTSTHRRAVRRRPAASGLALLLATPESDATLATQRSRLMGVLGARRGRRLPSARARRRARPEARAARAADLAEAARGAAHPARPRPSPSAARLAAERRWTAGLLDELESGALVWPAADSSRRP